MDPVDVPSKPSLQTHTCMHTLSLSHTDPMDRPLHKVFGEKKKAPWGDVGCCLEACGPTASQMTGEVAFAKHTLSTEKWWWNVGDCVCETVCV